MKGRGSGERFGNRFDRHQVEESHNSFSYDEDFFEEDPSTRIIEVEPKSIVNRIDSPDVPSEWGVNPYQGCEHGCAYCYARPTHEYWGYDGGLDFEKTILVKKDPHLLLQKKLSSKSWRASPIMLSGNTDCYQPVERKLGLTRKILQVFKDYHHPVSIITKNALVLRDLDILKDLNREGLIHVTISITTLNEKLRRHMEPRTSTAAQRLRAVQELSGAGIPVTVNMAPVIPALNSTEIFDLAKAVSEAGAKQLHYIVVRLNGVVQQVFADWLERHYPDRKKRVMSQIEEIHGGGFSSSDFGKRMKGSGNTAMIIRRQFEVARERFNLDQKLPDLNCAAYTRSNPDQISLF